MPCRFSFAGISLPQTAVIYKHSVLPHMGQTGANSEWKTNGVKYHGRQVVSNQKRLTDVTGFKWYEGIMLPGSLYKP